RDDRGQRERQVDDRVDDPLPPETVADEHPRQHGPHHGVYGRGAESQEQREPERGERAVRRRDGPEGAGAVERRPQERRQRQQDHHREVRDGEADPEPRADARGPERPPEAEGAWRRPGAQLRWTFATIPLVGSKKTLFARSQPPNWLIVNRPAGRG